MLLNCMIVLWIICAFTLYCVFGYFANLYCTHWGLEPSAGVAKLIKRSSMFINAHKNLVVHSEAQTEIECFVNLICS